VINVDATCPVIICAQVMETYITATAPALIMINEEKLIVKKQSYKIMREKRIENKPIVSKRMYRRQNRM
ncbi:MAG: hypothetical protein ABFD07_16900, partial [Methanobacterium sp.]